MTLQGADFLRGCQIPQFDSAVKTTTGKGYTIGTYGDGINRVGMPLQGADFLFDCQIPQNALFLSPRRRTSFV